MVSNTSCQANEMRKDGCGCSRQLEQTLSIIKPDAVAANHIGAVCNLLEKAGLRIIAAKMKQLTREEAEGFYAIHKDRPFFGELVSFMTSGPVVVMVLEGKDAVIANRNVMGATDPKKAESGTIRQLYGAGIEANAVHGSDSKENAVNEIQFFFSQEELCPRKK